MPIAPWRAPDTITVEVIGRRLLAASDEMFATLVRSSYSPNIRERRDCSVGIFTPEGALVAMTAIGPIHLSSLMGVVENVRGRFGPGELRPGDCFMTNDPYVGGGSHLPDITLISPVFHSGELVAFVANLAHHSDIGGRVAGSESADCTSIYQEGLRIPVVRLLSEDVLHGDTLEFLLLNSRTPRERKGDIMAQIAANRTGSRRLAAVFERSGKATVRAAIDALLDHAERRTRSAIAQIPPGTYESEDALDNDGISERDTPLRLRMTVQQERIVFDFSGTSRQVAGARNMPLNATLAAAYYAIKALVDPDLPANSGTYRCVDVIAPTGTVFNAAPPAAVGDRAATGNILGDLIFAAMAKADPNRVMAGCGPYAGLIISGRDPRNGEYFVDYETFAGAGGAMGGLDGRDAVRVHVSGSANLPIEALEQEYPLAVLRYELVTDSGGPGRWRGGLSTRRDIVILAEEARLAGRGLRQRRGAHGLLGGAPGHPGAFVLDPGTQWEKRLGGTFSELPVRQGSVMMVRTPSGGGYGPPRERDADAVLADVRNGKISVARAREDYGVEIIDDAIEVDATRTLRSNR